MEVPIAVRCSKTGWAEHADGCEIGELVGTWPYTSYLLLASARPSRTSR